MKVRNQITSFGYILKDSGLDDKLFDKLNVCKSELESIFNAATARANSIDKSDTFTAKGKLQSKIELAQEINEQLQKFDRLANKEMHFQTGPSIALEIKQLQESMKKPFDAGVDPTLEFMRHQEIRTVLRQIGDPLKAEFLVRKKCESGNFAFLDAAISAPEGSQQFISDKAKEVLLMSKMKSANPEAAVRIEQLRLAQSRLLGMVSSLKYALKKADLNLDQDQPVEFLDAS